MLTATIYTLLGIQVIVSFLMIVTVLMQRPKSEGLGAAFGGGMTENLFGAQTTSVLATFTRWLGGIFLMLTLLLSVLYAKQTGTRSAIQQQLMKARKPVAAAPAAGMAGSAAALSGSSSILSGTTSLLNGSADALPQAGPLLPSAPALAEPSAAPVASPPAVNPPLAPSPMAAPSVAPSVPDR